MSGDSLSSNKTEPDFCLIANSHGFALLDGITHWRENNTVSSEDDKNLETTFQGFYTGGIIGTPFSANVVDIDRKWSLTKIQAWVITPGAKIEALAQLDTSAESGIIRINTRLTEVLESWSGCWPIVSMLGGHHHNSFMLNSLPAYDFLEPELPTIEVDVPIIDDIFVDQHINAWTASIYHTLIAIKKSVKNPLIHILPPPPQANPHLSCATHDFKELIIKHGFASDQLRLKWYLRYCRTLTALLEAIDVQVLKPPLTACTSDGMLLKEEYADGLFHANSKYGALIAEQIAFELVKIR